jgi:hypothetical protein
VRRSLRPTEREPSNLSGGTTWSHSRHSPFVSMVQSANLRKRDNRTCLASLDGSRHRCILVKR